VQLSMEVAFAVSVLRLLGHAEAYVQVLGGGTLESDPAAQAAHATCSVGLRQYCPAGHITEAVEPAGQYCAGVLQVAEEGHEVRYEISTTPLPPTVARSPYTYPPPPPPVFGDPSDASP
jgi:hypothetical protein